MTRGVHVERVQEIGLHAIAVVAVVKEVLLLLIRRVFLVGRVRLTQTVHA